MVVNLTKKLIMQFKFNPYPMLKYRWHATSGYREVLKLALPLILSTSSTSLQHFVDRMFLTWYSPEAIAASVPGGILSFTLMCLFLGTAAYVNPFVAQYYGARQYPQIAPIIWQGIYFALFSGLIFFVFVPIANPIFNLINHEPAVKILEIQYFRVLVFGAPAVFLYSAVTGFFSGRGDTWTILWVSFAATLVNIVFDYLLIFGKVGFPEMGMRGAGLATVLSNYSSAALISVLMMRRKFRDQYQIWSNKKFNFSLFKRLMRFGLPNGIHFLLDLTGFTIFILLVGRFGTIALAATNITFNINSIAFMPMIGLGMAVEIIVGQRLGENRPDLARFGTYSALQLTLTYTILMSLSYILIPRIYLLPFAAFADPGMFVQVESIAIILLYFVAFYSLFDTMNIIFSNALRGAGDTRFVMLTAVILSWITMIIPTYLGSLVYNWGLYATWAFLTLYIVMLGIVFFKRFLGGKWETMRVIEEVPLVITQNLPESPVV